MCNQSILNEGKEDAGFSCVVFSGWKKRFLERKKSLICYVILDPGHDFKKVKSA